MKATIEPVTTDLVLIGGGHAHAIALRMFGMNPLPGLRLTLIADTSESAYSGMLPGHVANFYTHEQCHINLCALADFAGAQLCIDRAIGLDLAAKQVLCVNRPPVAFDLLSIDIGSTPALPKEIQDANCVIPAKPVRDFLTRWDAIVEQVTCHPEQNIRLAIVGGGAGGVELALNMQRRLQDILTAADQPLANLEIHLIHRGLHLLPQFNSWVRDRVHQLLAQRGIQLHLGEAVQTVQSHYILCQSGLELHCDDIIWVTQAVAPAWLGKSGLAVDEQGFVLVNNALQSLSHPFVFAAGDIAAMVNHPRPKAGVFAVRQAKPLVHNLRRWLQHQPLQPFYPQKRYLSLIGTADGQAIAVRGQLGWRSPWLWKLKQRIDRRFMERLNHLPVMTAGRRHERDFRSAGAPGGSPLPTPGFMPCEGCGSKVGSTVLTHVLQRIRDHPSLPPAPCLLPAVISLGLDTADDAAVIQVPAATAIVQTIDYFTALINDPFVFGQISANHALSDLFAMGAMPHSALAIATVPYGSEAKVEESLYQLLSGAVQVLHQTGATLIGGHTIEGTQLAFGLSCNGLAEEKRLLRKGGMQPGQALILTKPLGTGILFAAKMRRQAQGSWIDEAVEMMLRSNQAAAECFLNAGATACTDITGFGLIGHLMEMIQASKVAVHLNFNAIPVLAGAQAAAEMGIVSSLQPQNLKVSRFIQSREDIRSDRKFQLLFDPQTSGGLLASVPAAHADDCLKQLKASGYEQSVTIGHTLPLTELLPIAISD